MRVALILMQLWKDAAFFWFQMLIRGNMIILHAITQFLFFQCAWYLGLSGGQNTFPPFLVSKLPSCVLCILVNNKQQEYSTLIEYNENNFLFFSRNKTI